VLQGRDYISIGLTESMCVSIVLIPVPFSCESPILGWLILAVLLLVVRVVVLYLVWLAWIQRQQSLRSARASSTSSSLSGWDRRIPIIPLISTWQTAGGIAFVALLALNLINSRKGTSMFAGMMLWMLPVFLIQAFTLKKVVGLGSKIFRFSGGSVSRGIDLFKADQSRHISKFDQVLSLLGGVSSKSQNLYITSD
jgi:hypothetical protein